MEMVRIVHPEAGESYVPKSAVPAWRSSGWEEAPLPPEEEQVDDKAEQQDSKPSGSRRRSNKESE